MYTLLLYGQCVICIHGTQPRNEMIVFLIKIRLVTNAAVATEWQLAKHKRSRREETKLREQGGGTGPKSKRK